MSLRFSLTRVLYAVATLVVFAAAAHICIVLMMPYLARGNAWTRLEQVAKENKLTMLDETGPVEPLPFMAPDVRYAACRYDLSAGPVELRSPLPNDLWSVALYSQTGENYYLISGRDVQSRAVNLLLVMDATLDNDEKELEQLSENPANKALREVTVSAPDEKGIILIRAPVLNKAYNDEVKALLKSAYCRPVEFVQQTAAHKPQ